MKSKRNRHTGRVNAYVKRILEEASKADPQRTFVDSKGQRYAFSQAGFVLKRYIGSTIVRA